MQVSASTPDLLNKQQRSTGSSETKTFHLHSNIPSAVKQKEMLRDAV